MYKLVWFPVHVQVGLVSCTCTSWFGFLYMYKLVWFPVHVQVGLVSCTCTSWFGFLYMYKLVWFPVHVQVGLVSCTLELNIGNINNCYITAPIIQKYWVSQTLAIV